jgi:hypothetical protein
MVTCSFSIRQSSGWALATLLLGSLNSLGFAAGFSQSFRSNPSEESSIWVDQMVGKFSDEPELPDRPRRSVTLKKEYINSTNFTVGLNVVGLGGVELGGTFNTVFSLNVLENLVLVRHSPRGEKPLYTAADGSQHLNWDDEFPIVGMCTYKAGVTGSYGLVGTTTFFGNGVRHKEDFEQGLSIEQGSKYFAVQPEDSIASLQSKCFDHFNMQVKDSVSAELKKIIRANIFYINKSSQSDEYRAIQTALYGPYGQVYKIGKRTLSIGRAYFSRHQNGIFMVKGEVSEVLPLWTNNSVTYSIRYKDGIVTASFFHISNFFGGRRDQALVNDIKPLVEMIGAEALLQFGAEASEVTT